MLHHATPEKALRAVLGPRLAASLPVVPAAPPDHLRSAVVLGLGGATLITGAVLLWIAKAQDSDSAPLSTFVLPVIGDRSVGLTWFLRW